MVLSIKLRDNIVVPQATIDSGKYLLGLDYSVGQNIIRSINLVSDETSFPILFTKILNLFKPSKVFNLYHLVNSVELAETILINNYYNKNIIATVPMPTPEMFRSTDNFLSYFGFQIAKYPTETQLNELMALKTQNIITHFWIEGETQQIQSSTKRQRKNLALQSISYPLETTQKQFQLLTNPNSPQIFVTDSIQNLAFENVPKRGAGATIIAIEDDATGDLDKLGEDVNVIHFKEGSATFGTLGTTRFGNTHQKDTLRTLYGDSTGYFKGISPYANLIVCSLDYLPQVDSLDMNFKKKKDNIVNILSQIRKNLFTIYKQSFQNAVVLFEFETWIPFGRKAKGGEYFPTTIIYDIEKLIFKASSEQNIIVACPSGNRGNDLNNLIITPWKLNRLDYVDLTQKNLPFILVGATENKMNAIPANFTISEDTTYGKNLDVYVYTNFNVNKAVKYDKTSGAVAVVAGIMAYLQGKALSGENLLSQNSLKSRKLTTQNMKDIFSKTFMRNFPRDTKTELNFRTSGIIDPTVTLESLWIECEKLLNSSLSQHQ